MIVPPLAFYLALAHRPAPHGRPSVRRATIAKPAGRPPSVKMDEIGISGQTTQYDGIEHTYSITGHVRIALKNMTVTCDQAVLHTSADEERVETILFTGHVIAVRGLNTFYGDKVTYYVATKRLLAQGDTATRIRMPVPNEK